MIETVVLNYLDNALDVPVLMELPDVPSEDYPTFPDSLVTIERIGGSVRNHVYTATFAFQSYASSLANAALLDGLVRAAMDNIVSLPAVGGCRMVSNYNFTDTRTKRYRYQCVYEVYHVEGV